MDNIPKDETQDQDVQTDEMAKLQKLESIETSTNDDDTAPQSEALSFTPSISESLKPHEAATALSAFSHDAPHRDDSDSHAAKRFLIGYVTSLFSALSLLFSTSYLGYVLFDHFISEKKDSSSWFYFDLAPLYISVMASIIVFSLLYILSTHYVAKKAANDTIGLRDWRVYKTVYSFFSASLLVIAASVLAGLLYIPLAQLMIADDLSSTQITIQVLSGLHVLVWVALLIWQERLVKHGKHAKLQGVIVVAIALAIVVLTAIFPVGSKADERRDHRTESDLSSIQTELEKYKDEHKDELPATLSDLKFANDSPVKKRLSHYGYTVKTIQPTQTDAEKKLKALQDAASNITSLSAEVKDSSESLSDLSSLYPETPEDKPVVAKKSYELCATFKTDTTKKDSGVANPLSSLSSSLTSSSYSFDSHKSGLVCFTRT